MNLINTHPIPDATSVDPRALSETSRKYRATAAAAVMDRPTASTRSERLRAIAQLDATARALAVAARRRNGMDPAPASTR